MINTIIFDFGGVLGTDADTVFIEVLENHGISKEKANEIWNQYWPKLKEGTSGVEEIWKSVKLELNEDIKLLIDEYEDKIEVYPEIIEFCKKIKKRGYNLGILANEALEWMDIKRIKGNLNGVFDKVYSSADLKMYKPNPEAYKMILRNLNAKSSEAIFIDNMERNTKAAESIGIKSILFENLEQLKQELTALNIIK